MRRSDKVVLEKILNAVEEAQKVLNNTPQEIFLNSAGLKLAMGMSIIRVGEFVKNLSAELRLANPQIAWKDIAGFRDVAAHKYDILRMQDVYLTVTEDFPELKLQIEKILKLDAEKN